MDKIHVPVLLNESIDSLNIKPDGFYVDCTLGDGGHSQAILKQLSSKGLLLSIDQDSFAIEFVKDFYKAQPNWIIKQSNFRYIDKLVAEIGRTPDGILMDLGLSSRQLEESHNRGFSYQEDNEPLDMRMDTNLGVTAKDILVVLNNKQLAKLFLEYGEERYCALIAKTIKENIDHINTVGDLTRLIYKVVPANNTIKNPSRRVFQALRIVVNDELDSLTETLDRSFKLLSKNGRLSVISFHSLEDRIVKTYFNDKAGSGEGELLFKSSIAPTDTEIEQNSRSASAKLRCLIKN
ncbi:MAG: Ribosomal RNA small subunit methyltransferase H [candidate division WS6 bacterium GW2011_GWC1_36_11]|uniref:Ribosomal RNA small subunit methyltransferase H n=3 Tax=Candidatus Dojkabacteria TaxID=74243 RepID=A0A0G0DER3_9BACT|nr:MAG: Ribosomal RNA small subunit methyltransferase H [candidate division WS6 bacterium GW2011_GWC1_36_11]KKQ11595.1 MAG: Ribosomal RNA small subunit methyltransferase H [candidate division WS6 bacterium GW2011_GWC2_36_7]HAM37750.1 16S rRNA (cytosine(1402)-N(4))-methyltransferase [Patescibacteria group bacterium]HAM96394.1 16S rRNA (cytosine(1402)-N(4))-methyltransferase [Patescibacteria group bacterium]